MSSKVKFSAQHFCGFWCFANMKCFDSEMRQGNHANRIQIKHAKDRINLACFKSKRARNGTTFTTRGSKSLSSSYTVMIELRFCSEGRLPSLNGDEASLPVSNFAGFQLVYSNIFQIYSNYIQCCHSTLYTPNQVWWWHCLSRFVPCYWKATWIRGLVTQTTFLPITCCVHTIETPCQ